MGARFLLVRISPGLPRQLNDAFCKRTHALPCPKFGEGYEAILQETRPSGTAHPIRTQRMQRHFRLQRERWGRIGLGGEPSAP